MNRLALLFALFVAFGPFARAVGEEGVVLGSPEPETEQSTEEDEGEEKDIIPRSAAPHPSTQPVTPITPFPEKPPYDLAREELSRAETLWRKGEAEAASDTALEAYDDLMEIRRRRKKERRKLFAERARAATVYVNAGIRFIQDFVERQGRTPAAIEEGGSRLEDLRDVARNYPALNRNLNKALAQLSAPKKP